MRFKLFILCVCSPARHHRTEFDDVKPNERFSESSTINCNSIEKCGIEQVYGGVSVYSRLSLFFAVLVVVIMPTKFLVSWKKSYLVLWSVYFLSEHGYGCMADNVDTVSLPRTKHQQNNFFNFFVFCSKFE